MSSAPAAPDQPDASTDDPAGVERQRAKLDRLGDMALELVEILMHKARAADGEAELERIALAVARVSRVVRLTCALHVRLAQTRQAIEKDQISLDNGHSYRDATGRTDQRAARKHVITRVIARVALRDEGLDEEETLDVLRDCREQLDDDTLVNLMDRPVSELIAEFCKSLGLTPDWEALAAEAWARKEIEGGDVGAPLAAIAERLIAPPQARRSRSRAPRSRPHAAPSIAIRAASP